jgi:histidine ammonia-lyase
VLTSDGKVISGASALKKAGLKPITFKAKEGLAWNNGTSVMSGVGCLAIVQAERLMELADMSCALTLEAICGMSDPFKEEVHKIPTIGSSYIQTTATSKAIAKPRLSCFHIRAR